MRKFFLLSPRNGINVDTPNRSEFQKLNYNKLEKNLLGRGSYGIVIKAFYKGKPVAAKILNCHHNYCSQSLKQESNIIGWSHVNIIEVLKIVTEPSYGLVIMERLDGQCLQDVISQYKLPLRHRLQIMLDIVQALIYCHKMEVIHLDVKPQNILIALQTDGELIGTIGTQIGRKYICKLSDFGCSIKFGDIGNGQELHHCQGTARYMAPELLQGLEITKAADIFSFGITMWQIKSNQCPYANIEDNDVVIYRIVKDNLRPDDDKNETECNMRKEISIRTEIPHIEITNTEGSDNIIRNSSKYFGSDKCIFKITRSNRFFSTSVSNKISPTNICQLHRLAKQHKLIISDPGEIDGQIYYTILFEDRFSNSSKLSKELLKLSENKYNLIYKCCWNRNYLDRPKLEIVSNSLLKILEGIVNNI